MLTIVTAKTNGVSCTDAELVQKIRQGDEQAFYTFYKRHVRYIAGVANKLMETDSDIDDMIQDTFVTAAQKIYQLRQPEHVRLWLVTIAIRHIRKRLRRRSRIKLQGLATNLNADNSSNMRAASKIEDLREAIGDLPHKFTTPWVLHRLEGNTIQEVADICRISAATVKRRVSTVERKLRSRIDDSG